MQEACQEACGGEESGGENENENGGTRDDVEIEENMEAARNLHVEEIEIEYSGWGQNSAMGRTEEWAPVVSPPRPQTVAEVKTEPPGLLVMSVNKALGIWRGSISTAAVSFRRLSGQTKVGFQFEQRSLVAR